MLCKKPYIKSVEQVSATRLRFNQELRNEHTPFGCGQCMPCRINKAREWTLRIYLESKMHSASDFLTLTYDEEHLPENGELDVNHFTQFIRKVRKKLPKFRFFGVGEYGDKSARPHYHVALFGIDPIRYRQIIDNTWKKGRTNHGYMEKNSARYIAGYCIKKLTKKDNPYLKALGKTKPEFMRSSRNEGGIGAPFIDAFAEKIKMSPFKNDIVIGEMNIEKRSYPLGRYLSKRLADKVGYDQHLLDKRLYDYQQDLFDKYLNKDNGFLTEMMTDLNSKILTIERRQRIFKTRRTI